EAGPWCNPELNPHANEISYSSATPCTDGERVYVSFSSGVIAAVDYQGKLIWRSPKADTGTTACSLVYYRGVVVQKWRTNSSGAVRAFDCGNGEVKYHGGYESPVPVLIQGVPLFLIHPFDCIHGINPEDGKAVWSVKRGGFPCIGDASIAVGDGMAYAPCNSN